MAELFPPNRTGTPDALDPPEMWPANYPPAAEDTVLPWLPTDPIPDPEPVSPSLGMPDTGVYEGTNTADIPL